MAELKINDIEQERVISEDQRIDQEREGHELPTLQYSIEDIPPWHLCLTLGFQQFITMAGGPIGFPLLISAATCIEVGQETDEVAKAELMTTAFFAAGIVTFLQSTFGCRLPIIQGGNAAFFPPLFAIFSTFGKCPTVLSPGTNLTEYYLMNPNSTHQVVITGSEEHREVWRERMRAGQGALIVASIFELVAGFSGVMGILLRFIGPLTISVTIALVGLSLASISVGIASSQWGIAFMTFTLILIFSQYMGKVKVPCYSKEHGGCSRSRGFPLFKLFPVILAILVAYIVSIILTYTNVFPDDKDHIYYKARTDSRISVLTNAKWFRFPYPGQWGMPTVSIAGVFGMLAATIASIIESVGDYYAAARISGASPPTTAAINRGIGIEGLGGILAGAWGLVTSTTSYSGNIGAIALTKVGSRRVVQVAAIFMLIAGVFSKFCAVFVTIPDPVMGGTYLALFGLIGSIGLSNLQYVDLNSSRNLFILGSSLFIGLGLPDWITKNQGVINTGEPVVDEIFQVLLSTSMFVGGGLAFFLDNTIPGTQKERGMTNWVQKAEARTSGEKLETYDLPFGNGAIYRAKWTSYIPVCPNFMSHRQKTAQPESNGRFETDTSINKLDGEQVNTRL